MNLSIVINKLNELRDVYGDLEVKIVNYHSDYKEDSIEVLDDAIKYMNGDIEGYIIIGGETY